MNTKSREMDKLTSLGLDDRRWRAFERIGRHLAERQVDWWPAGTVPLSYEAPSEIIIDPPLPSHFRTAGPSSSVAPKNLRIVQVFGRTRCLCRSSPSKLM
jgi:hypothetical protein